MSISPNRDPLWTDDLEAILFGLYEPRHKDGVDDTTDGAADADGAPAAADASRTADAPSSDDKVDLVLWHYKDPRLQTQQEVQEARDRAYNYVAEYRVQAKKFIRLADDSMRNVTLNPRQSRWGFGSDDREYELMGSLDGRRHEDMFVIDLTTGARKMAIPHVRYFSGPSPDGSKLLYYENGDYHVFSLATGQDKNITQGLPVSFVDVEDDHNNVKPPVGAIGWASDSKTVLLTDAWDIWQVSSRRRAGGEPHRQRQEGRDPLPAPLPDSSRATIATRGSICRSRSTSPPTASGPRRPASRVSIPGSPA